MLNRKIVAGISCAITALSLDRAAVAESTGGTETNQPSAVVMMECEQGSECAIWTFLDSLGSARLPTGETASLSLQVDGDKIVIHRADTVGPTRGLTATYTGTYDSDGLSGRFTSSWPGHWKNRSGHWFAYDAGSPLPLPTVMHECDLNCLTLTLVNGEYVASHQRWEPPNIKIVWTVESFSGQAVTLHRTYPVNQVFRGQIAPSGTSLMNVTVNGVPDPKVRIAWGAELNTLPANNEQRDGVSITSPAQTCDADCTIHGINTILDGIELFQRLSRMSGANSTR